jgi:hypothetical protein
MEIIGDWFTTCVSLTFGQRRYVLRLEKGEIVAIVVAPRLDGPCAFGFRAPLRAWRRFLSRTPPPLYHDFFAMMMRAPVCHFSIPAGKRGTTCLVFIAGDDPPLTTLEPVTGERSGWRTANPTATAR